MATDADDHPDKSPMTVGELVAFTRQELNADAERQAKLQAAGAGELPRESQTGATLDLSHKEIRVLPAEIIHLIRDRVERLALSHNPSISVPRDIVQCDRLRYLNIRWNGLDRFPDAVLQLSKLEILDLSKNKIVSIPEDIKMMASLKFLAVARNRIARLPLALGEMNSLTKLKFDENPIEFPPPEALKSSQGRMGSALDAEKEKDVCQKVKRFLKQAALRERLMTHPEEELSESNVETPRPPKRTVTIGRFPIRPSISGVDNVPDIKSEHTPEHQPPPIPQRSHARVSSITGPTGKRPGIAPLLTDGNDMSRSRSETVSSSASLRSRRQGFVPTRKGSQLKSVSETSDQNWSRSSQASTIRPTHSRGVSSVSNMSGFLAVSSGTSSGAGSPMDSPRDPFGRLRNSPLTQNPGGHGGNAIRCSKRLLFTLSQLHHPIHDATVAIKDGTNKHTVLERSLVTAHVQLEELDRLLGVVDNPDENMLAGQDVSKAIVRTSLRAMKLYRRATLELRRYTDKLATVADGIYIRNLMSQIFNSTNEARNICTVLGFQIQEISSRETPRAHSQAWSSRTVTPTQSKPSTSRRVRNAPSLHSMASSSTLRTVPPPVPLTSYSSRSNTMSSSVSATTPRSTDSFSTIATSITSMPNLSRTNTMRSMPDDGSESDRQWSNILERLQRMCSTATDSLPHCRLEFIGRRDRAGGEGQPRAVKCWTIALNKCEAAIQINKSLKKRLEAVRVHDPGLKYQRDFWQLCDSFVHAWVDLATEIKNFGSQQRIDTHAIKLIMRNVQGLVKDVSKTISRLPLYHQVMGNTSSSQHPHGLAPAFPAGMGSTTSLSSLSSGYVTPIPATPLSAALGPAAQATVASTTPNGSTVPRDYFQHEVLPSSRIAHARVDTVMQPAGHLRRNG